MHNYNDYNIAVEVDNDYVVVGNTLLKGFSVIKKNSCVNHRSGKDQLLKGEEVLELLSPETLEELTKHKIIADKELDIEYLNEVMSNPESVSATIVLGYECNMKCVYCYEQSLENKPKQDIKMTLYKITDFLVEYVKKNKLKGLNLEFYGGEPMIYYDEIIKTAEEVSKYIEYFTFTMMTNGTLLNLEKVKKLKTLGLKKVEISLDGEEKVHNSRRPLKNQKNSYRTIIENVKEICEEIPVVIRVNIDETNYDKINVLIQELDEEQLQDKIYIYFTDVIKCKNQLCTTSSESIYEAIGRYYEEAQRLGFRVPFRMYSIGPCHFYRKHMYGIKPNGDICKCLALEHSSVGNVTSETPYIDKALETPCLEKNCTYYPICFGGCVYAQEAKKVACPKSSLDIILKGFLRGKGIQQLLNVNDRG